MVVGGGFAGIEVFGELRSLATALLKRYPQLTFDDTHFHLIEAMGRIMPEVSLPTSHWVIKNLAAARRAGAPRHAAEERGRRRRRASTGETFESDLIVWTAGVMANPMVRDTDLPVEERGRLRVRADLRVVTDEAIVPDAWGAGDVSAVPDLTGDGVGGFCVPNAQHAVRQGKLLAKNIVADLRGEAAAATTTTETSARSRASASTIGVFQSGKIAVKGFPAWVMHRGYHGLAMPDVGAQDPRLVGWVLNFLLGRDMVHWPPASTRGPRSRSSPSARAVQQPHHVEPLEWSWVPWAVATPGGPFGNRPGRRAA